MSDQNASLQDRLAALRASFRDGLPARLEQIEAAVDAALEGASETWHTVERLSHKLAGSSLGPAYSAVSEAAHRLEETVRAARAAGGSVDESRLGDLRRALRRAVEGVVAGDPAGRAPRATELDGPAGTPAARADGELVFVVDDDAPLAEQIALHLACFGYSARVFGSAEGLSSAVAEETPAAILMDIVLPEGDLAGTSAIASLREAGHGDVPVVFMSARRDLTARLEAVAAGGSEYLPKPIDLLELVEKLDRLTASAPGEPYRALVVDADPHRAKWRREAFERAGMRTQVVSDPLAIDQPLATYHPDVVLMHDDIPGWSGIHLAKTIRQHRAHAGVPILFLSEDPLIARRLAMERLTGEPFLVEPVDTDYLALTARSLAERARTLQTLLVNDNVTGLAARARILEIAEREIARALEMGIALSYALVDVDGTKAVNDALGHATGDRVIRALGRLLEQQLREGDSVGRYERDQLSVVLPGTGSEAAVALLDRVRRAFCQVRAAWHDGDGLSAGVASLSPSRQDLEALHEGAREALEDAKRRGRNRIVAVDEG